MLLLALGSLRVSDRDADVADALRRGDVQEALRLGLGRLDRGPSGDPQRLAALGQVLGQALLAAGRDEQAEELFQKQLRLYEALPRAQVRWFSSMDRGFLFLHLNKPGRAAESFNVVADAEDAPLALRVDALAGMAQAMQAMGEHRRATRTLAVAAALASSPQAPAAMRALLTAIGLEIDVCRAVRRFDDVPAVEPARERETVGALRASASALAAMPAAVARLEFLIALMTIEAGQSGGGHDGLFDGVRWQRERRLPPLEERARVEAALALLERGQARTAYDILGPLAIDDGRQLHHRHAIELRYCASKLHAVNGRHADALRCYRQHAQLSLARLRFELTRMPYSRFLEQQERAEQADADQLRLPPRYRRAYQYILDHLHDRTLSVRRIAAEIDVTERALQMAFRSHLGLTPAEVIRKLRMACIRTELQQMAGRDSVLAVAARWGLANRSTLAHNYRQQFGETPSATSGQAGQIERPSIAVAMSTAAAVATAAAAIEPPRSLVLGAD
ncbi:helix-turn-helix transcriptional regulator [Mitsuaria sp. GD03876]|uniref:helix-turn-helix transcriptional regulator n=1 Tax=Mitsuaria sp. GD03876 TaxID=2975399 RepID=UPI00244B86AA|nr:helix-turn-helix transcriptional regulator [Mitsuaria sp. GD03876]MDH0866044.1 helix-turn-helix transcriptional regulator [Mitsuaria sp. GD03876]